MKSPLTRILLVLVALALAGAAMLGFIAWTDTNVPRVTRVRIPVVGITREYRLLQVSDLHGKRFGTGQKKIRELLAGRTYDAVLFTGDLGGADGDQAPLRELVAAVKPTTEKVAGIHVEDYLEPLGVRDLQRTGPLQLGEVDVASTLDPDFPAFPPRDDGAKAVVAVTHVPLPEVDIKRMRDTEPRMVALLEGHYHGGQIRLPFLGAIALPQGLHYEELPLLPERHGVSLEKVQYQDDVWVVKTNGLGTQGRTKYARFMRFRFLAPAEMTEVVLVPSP